MHVNNGFLNKLLFAFSNNYNALGRYQFISKPSCLKTCTPTASLNSGGKDLLSFLMRVKRSRGEVHACRPP